MKLLLKKDVRPLGYVGDLVEVKEGYARNYLLPQGLALEPTTANLKFVEQDRVRAAEERHIRAEERAAAAERLADTEVTIHAAANLEGALYGSVGPREIAAALRQEGHSVETDQVQLHEPIRHLDNVQVPVRFSEDMTVQVKVWVVRQAGSEIDGDDDTKSDSTGAQADGDDALSGDE